jgi:endonuclease I
MNRDEKQRRLVSFVQQFASSGSGLESLPSDESEANPMYHWVEQAQASDEERDIARRAVHKLVRKEELTPREEHAAEAIILPRGRPVLDIVNGIYTTPQDPWTHLDRSEFRRTIEAAISSIGRVEIPNHPSLPYAGTGFVVGDELLMTNRHVAELFVLGLGMRDLRFRSGIDKVGVDFRRESGSTASEFFTVTQVLMVHPFWDMALLRTEGLDQHAPLVLDATPAEEVNGREVAVVGYPAFDPRNDADLQNRIFGGRFQVKRMQPGTLTGARNTRSFGHTVPALTHNSSTLGGNSGSAIVDVENGRVLGLHFGGVYLDTNYGVPSYQLSCDGRVVDAGVRFNNTHVTTVPWNSFWDRTEEIAVRVPAPSSVRTRTPVVALRDRGVRATSGGGALELTLPLRVTFTLEAPTLGRLASPSDSSSAGVSARTLADVSTAAEVQAALARAQETEALPYYDAVADRRDRQSYYRGTLVNGHGEDGFEVLHRILLRTHARRPSYKPSEWLYPWVDRQKNGRIRSLYSAAGRTFTLEEMLEMDVEVERFREERIAELPMTEAASEEAIEAIEAMLPFNCEHVVPQSWFQKKEPMRGDLHHLFACESGCNSFRGNRAYFAFTEEAFRDDCGQSDKNKFEPGAGRGAVARATFYFMVRYPGLVSGTEMPRDRIDILLQWHVEDPVSEWELHRNQAIFAIQGNRNPFIDSPEWVSHVDFAQGLTGARGPADESVPEV